MSDDEASRAAAAPGSGIAFGLAAYGLWGVVPAYWKLLSAVPATELLAQRVLWSLGLALLLLVATGGVATWRAVLGSPRHVLPVSAAAVLLAVNWLVFIYAVATDRVLATSLGYYLNPLLNVLLGLFVLGEGLRRLQAVAVVIAAVGVGYYVFALGTLPWISVVLAATFGLYGLVRKMAPVDPIVGFGVEMTVLSLPSAAFLALLYAMGEAQLPTGRSKVDWLVPVSGIVTAVPLICFNAAAKRLTLIAVGILQYVAPSIALVLAVVRYDEPFEAVHAVTFGLVWLALAIFTVDSVWLERR